MAAFMSDILQVDFIYIFGRSLSLVDFGSNRR